MKLKCFSFFLFTAILTTTQLAQAGVLKSLDQELKTLIENTDSYLVTVKGDGGWRDLTATGIIIDPHGYLLTSSQIYESSSFKVIKRDGRVYNASKVGVDYQTGLAVLKVVGEGFSPPVWGESESLKKGSLITVVGNSYGVPSTVFFGSYNGPTDDGMMRIMVDADPGTSGGAVIDIDGKVIGILVARESGSTPADSTHNSPNDLSGGSFPHNLGNVRGRCFAVASKAARDIARLLINDGKINRGYLGITSQTVRSRIQTSTSVAGGARITNLEVDSPAHKAGLQKGDIIISVDSDVIVDRASLISQIRSHKPGDTVLVGYARGNQQFLASVTLGESRAMPFLSGLELSQSVAVPATSSMKAPVAAKPDVSEVQKLRAEVSKLQAELRDLKQKLGEQDTVLKNP